MPLRRPSLLPHDFAMGGVPHSGLRHHSSILAWRISWTEEPGGLPSIRSQRVEHDLLTERALTVLVSPLKMCLMKLERHLLHNHPSDIIAKEQKFHSVFGKSSTLEVILLKSQMWNLFWQLCNRLPWFPLEPP